MKPSLAFLISTTVHANAATIARSTSRALESYDALLAGGPVSVRLGSFRPVSGPIVKVAA